MPDFAKNRPSERRAPARAKAPLRKRPDLPVSKGRMPKRLPKPGQTRQVRSGERPLAMFRKLLQDFQNGVSALKGLSKLQPSTSPMSSLMAPFTTSLKKVSNLSERTPNSSERIPILRGKGVTLPTITRGKPLVRFTPTPGPMREAPIPARLKSPPRTPSPQMPSGVRAYQRPLARQQYHTRTLGADREAQQQVLDGEYTGSVHHMPSAARLAQILRTESLIRSGEAQPNGTVFALAQAIREGRRREVADLNPEVVQNALSSALGGPTRAKQLLNDPITHRLITRHQIALESLQRDLRVLDPQRARVGSAGASTHMLAGRVRAGQDPRAPKFTPPSPALVSAASHMGPGSTVAHPNPPTGSGVETNLQEMITVNEAPHLNEVAMHERERLQNGLQTSGEAPPKSEFSPRQHGASYSPIGASATRSPIASFIDAPKPQPRAQAVGANEDKNREVQREQKVTGTFKLRGHNNQVLGIVELEDGEIMS